MTTGAEQHQGPYLVGIDCGSQSAKVVVYDAEGRAVARGQQPLQPMLRPRHGVVLHPDDDLWTATAAATRQAMAAFDGRATLRFRVTADNDCGGGTMVGAVTLAGGTRHQPGPGVSGGLIGEGGCGVGVIGVALMAQFGVLLVVAAQRWRRP